MTGLTATVLPALRGGIYATGEVIAGAGVARRLRVNLNGQNMEIGLRSRDAYQPGNRIDVMVDPVKQSVMLVLGAATT